jgi:hypothetical protein
MARSAGVELVTDLLTGSPPRLKSPRYGVEAICVTANTDTSTLARAGSIEALAVLQISDPGQVGRTTRPFAYGLNSRPLCRGAFGRSTAMEIGLHSPAERPRRRLIGCWDRPPRNVRSRSCQAGFSSSAFTVRIGLSPSDRELLSSLQSLDNCELLCRECEIVREGFLASYVHRFVSVSVGAWSLRFGGLV